MVRKYGKYRVLGQNEIRILRVPKAGHSSWHMEQLNIHKMPKYTALSYTWGPEEPMSTMLIDGNTIDIRQNLGEALYYLTQRLQSGRGVARTQYFWADAVCINQDNTEERRAQVQLMRQIYEHAQNVVVWLGKPRYPDHADHFFQLAGQLDRVAQEALKRAFPYRPWWMPAPPPANDKDIMYQLLGPLRANSGVWGSRGSTQYAAWQSFFFDFLKSPWWSRTWVYQEATIPEDLRQFGMPGIGFLKNESKVKFVFGESVISWVPLLNAVDVGLRLLNDALVLQELRQNFSAPGNQPIDYAKNTIALFANLQHLKRLRKD